MVFQARIQTQVREGVLSDELSSNEGLMGGLGSFKFLKMGTEKLALVTLVRPSRIFTYPQ